MLGRPADLIFFFNSSKKMVFFSIIELQMLKCALMSIAIKFFVKGNKCFVH